MFMDSMIPESGRDDILEALTSKELVSVTTTLNNEGVEIPLATATVSRERFAEFVKMTSATKSRETDYAPKTMDALFIDVKSKAGVYTMDHTSFILGIWTDVGEVLE